MIGSGGRFSLDIPPLPLQLVRVVVLVGRDVGGGLELIIFFFLFVQV